MLADWKRTNFIIICFAKNFYEKSLVYLIELYLRKIFLIVGKAFYSGCYSEMVREKQLRINMLKK